jgi:hypothetical protein
LETETETRIASHFIQVGGDDRVIADPLDVRVGDDIDRLEVVWVIPKATRFLADFAGAGEKQSHGIEARVGGHARLKLPAGQYRLFVSQHHRFAERERRQGHHRNHQQHHQQQECIATG